MYKGGGTRLNWGGCSASTLIARTGKLTANGPQGVLHILAERGALKMRGVGRAPTRTSRVTVAFRAASGDSFGNYTPKVAVFAHPTDAVGTKGGFEGETTSIEAVLIFTP